MLRRLAYNLANRGLCQEYFPGSFLNSFTVPFLQHLWISNCFENSSVLFLKRSIHPLVFWTKFQWLLGNYLRRNAVYITLQGILQLYYAGKWTSAQYFPGSIATFQRWWQWWWWIVFVVWLTDERRSALFRAGTIVRDLHHREAPTLREQCQA